MLITHLASKSFNWRSAEDLLSFGESSDQMPDDLQCVPLVFSYDKVTIYSTGL